MLKADQQSRYKQGSCAKKLSTIWKKLNSELHWLLCTGWAQYSMTSSLYGQVTAWRELHELHLTWLKKYIAVGLPPMCIPTSSIKSSLVTASCSSCIVMRQHEQHAKHPRTNSSLSEMIIRSCHLLQVHLRAPASQGTTLRAWLATSNQLYVL